jgi:hypothetical protein
VAAQGAFVDEEEGAGWLVFAATMLGLAGIMSVLDGIVGLAKSKFYFAGATYVVSDVRTWGWVVLLVGIVLILAAGGVLARSGFSRWFGIFAAGLSAISQFAWMQVYPFWSLVVVALDVMVIYALAMYGGRRST